MAAAERERGLFARRALRSRADEHRRIAEALHEGTIQNLSAVRLWLATARPAASPPVAAVLDRAGDLLAANLTELRDLLSGGAGADWSHDELAPALAGWLAGLPGGEKVSCELPGEPVPLHDPVVSVAFGVIKEAVRNALKHADAAAIVVAVTLDEAGLVAEVADDGAGIDPEAAAGLGLRLIRQAARTAGGQATVMPRPGGGTAVRLELPRGSADAAG